jgi:hypothetical protein
MAGYSGTPLVKKLGIKPGFCMFALKQPEGYRTWLEPLPEGVEIKQTLKGELDFIHVFVKERSIFEKEFVKCKKHLKKDGMLWVSWPKKSSGVHTDLDENIIRAVGLEAGLVDVKVCAVDDVWSGLKFVFRIKDR